MSVSDDDSGPIYRAQMARLPKECSHRRVFARIWSEGGDGQWITLLGHDQRCLNAHARVCADCGHWLSLGAAQDSGPHAASVACEIRAAEIASDKRARLSFCESLGWESWLSPKFSTDPVDAGYAEKWHAGYLARCIVSHAEIANAG